MPQPRRSIQPASQNRFLAALVHVEDYSGRFQGALSRDTGIPVRTLLKIFRGQVEPSYLAVMSLTRAISDRAGFEIPVDELLVPANAQFRTKYICDLFNCRCLPPWAYDKDDSFRGRFEGIPPGKWTFAAPSPDDPLFPFN